MSNRAPRYAEYQDSTPTPFWVYSRDMTEECVRRWAEMWPNVIFMFIEEGEED